MSDSECMWGERCCPPLRVVGQSSVFAHLDGDIVGANASSEAQESGNDGGETHIQEEKTRVRNGVGLGAVAKDGMFSGEWIDPAGG